MNHPDPMNRSELLIETFQRIEEHSRETARLMKHVRLVAILVLLMGFAILAEVGDVVTSVRELPH